MQALLVTGALLFLAKVFLERRDEIAAAAAAAHWPLVAASFILLVAAWLVLARGWHLVLKLLGVKRSPLACMRVFVLAQLGKYLPGNVWHYIGRVYLGKRLDIPTGVAIVGLYVETLLTIAGPLVVGLVTLLAWNEFPFWGRVPTGALLLGLTLLMLHPGSLVWLLTFLRQGDLAMQVRYRPAEVYALLPLYVGGWATIGVAFYLLVTAFAEPGPDIALPVIGAWSAAFIIGLVTPIAPAGMGVREGLLYLMLTPLTGAPVAVLVSLASRLWFILAEVITTGGVVLVARHRGAAWPGDGLSGG